MEKIEIYVDGSFIDGRTGYGFVVLKGGALAYEASGPVRPQDAQTSRQVAGELMAIGNAVRWCKAEGFSTITVYYDYLGVEKWATGKWKANLDLTKRYGEFMQNCGLKIEWRKVKSHSNNRWNDRADELARDGAAKAEPVIAADTDPYLIALQSKTDAFLAYLDAQGVDAELDKIYNNMYARILFRLGGEKPGYFDLYNTKNKPFNPYLHAFGTAARKEKALTLWKNFCDSTK